jgi:hypothetical protein
MKYQVKIHPAVEYSNPPPTTGELKRGFPLHREEKPASRMRKNRIYLISARNTHR